MTTAMRVYPMQSRALGKPQPTPLQSRTLPLSTTAAQIGIDLDLSSLMNLMITMMIIVMMMKMMTGAIGSVAK